MRVPQPAPAANKEATPYYTRRHAAAGGRSAPDAGSYECSLTLRITYTHTHIKVLGWEGRLELPEIFFEQGLNRFFMAKKFKRRRFGRFPFFLSRAVPIYLLIPEPWCVYTTFMYIYHRHVHMHPMCMLKHSWHVWLSRYKYWLCAGKIVAYFVWRNRVFSPYP